MWGNDNVELHTFVNDEKSNLKFILKLKGAKLVTSKTWGNNVGLHISVSGEKSDLKITFELKGRKLVISKNVRKQNVESFINLTKKLQYGLKNYIRIQKSKI
jgi:hypothetical protein